MKLFIDLIFEFWYVWVIVTIGSILSIYMPRIKGYLGEKSATLFLASLDKNKYKVINNVMLKVGSKITQIDHIVVSNYGVFVIETKNYKGRIIGSEFDDYWKQVIYKRKGKLYNPIKQNYGHVQMLKSVLKEYGNIEFISIITFTTKADLKINSETDVVYTPHLVKKIKKYKKQYINDFEKEKIYNKIIFSNVSSRKNRKAHIKAINDNLSDFHNEIKGNICPKCGGRLIVRNGKYGQFKGCSNYPKCRFTMKIV